jgi:plastocyanin
MANEMQPQGKNKALTVIIIAIIAILIIVLVVLALTQKEETNTPDGERNAPANETGDVDNLDEADLDEAIPGEEGMAGEEVPEALQNAESQVEGGNLVTEDNRVVTQEGEDARNDVEPGSPDAPQQTGPVDVEALPENTVRVTVSAEGFGPEEVRMPAETAVTMSVTSTDTQTHIFKFKDESLKAVAVGSGTGETRAITFRTPGPGEYEFYCDVPGHEGRGEVGTLIFE